MLTNNKNPKIIRKDRPWLLFITVILWIAGSCFFHEPWEPFEPYVVAIVKSILLNNGWLIPYIAPNIPYLDLQPFYFWVFALPIKIFHLTNLPDAIRVINAGIIYLILFILGRVGSSLSAYKNGRTSIMILISTVGFINCSYQLSPNLLVILGFSLFLYALNAINKYPSRAVVLLTSGLFCISMHFTAQNLYLAVFVLLVLPIIDKTWRFREYFLVISVSIGLFLFLFIMYAWQLYNVDSQFFHIWAIKYMQFIDLNQNFLKRYVDIVKFLSWYLVPGFLLFAWTIYRRGRLIVNDPILLANLLIFALIIFITGISKGSIEYAIFPIIIPTILIASVEVDTIKIYLVSLLNWFSIFIFGFIGLCIAILYFSLDFNHPVWLYQIAKQFAPNYQFRFDIWQFLLAIIITIIWLFMITRRHIRGREVISNWASGTTFVLVMFMSLCIPWFNSVLSFKDITLSSLKYINNNESVCVASHGGNKIQDAIWYYYTDIRLQPEQDLNNTTCKQAIVTVVNTQQVEQKYNNWHVIWSAKRPVDQKVYYLIERN